MSSNACKWDRRRQEYVCDRDQSTAILKAATETILEGFVSAVQRWVRGSFLPFYEARPGRTWILSIFIALFILRHHGALIIMGSFIVLVMTTIVLAVCGSLESPACH